jgi:hypothetical protein
MEAILSVSDMQSVLRSQVETLIVKSRRHTGVGFFADLAVTTEVEAINPPNIELGAGLFVEIANVPHGAGTVLFVRNGFLSMLELFTFSDPLPNEPVITNIQYSPLP